MKKLLFCCTILITAFFEVSLLGYFTIFNVKPDLLLILVVMAGASFDLRTSIGLAFLAGLCRDIAGVGSFGLYTFLFSIWGFLVHRLSRQASFDNPLVFVAGVYLVNFLQNIILRLSLMHSSDSIRLGIFLRLLFIQSFYTAAVSFFVLIAIERIRRYRSQRKI